MRISRGSHALLPFWISHLVAHCDWLVGDDHSAATDRAHSVRQHLSSPTEVARQLDTLLQQESESYGPTSEDAPGTRATKSRPLDDFGFLRRVTLDLTGHLPTSDEINAFVNDDSPDKRAALVDQLLDDPNYGKTWASYWRDVIMYRRTEDRGLFAVPALQQFLTEALNDNIPWDNVARSFVTARGDIREKGQTAIIAAHGGRPEETVAELSRIFLGVQIQCAQCHDHPTDRWSREQFHELAAFFPRTFVRPQRKGEQRTFLVASREFPAFRQPKNDRHIGQVEHFMPDLDDPAAKGTMMEPVFFVSGQRLELGTTDLDRRDALAEWITSPSNEWFAKALVNRIWAELTGHSFYPNVDDLGPDREPVYPETLEYLASSFVANGYDLKWLFRTITSTEVYHRQSRTRDDQSRVALTVPLQQRLRADQLFNALVGFLSFDQTQIVRRLDQMGRRGPRTVFSAVFGYDPSEPREELNGSVPQALVLMNGRMIERLISGRGRFGGLPRLLRRFPTTKKWSIELYLRALTRPPSRRELATVMSHLRKAEDRAEAFQDLIWALINSSEFIHRG